VLWKAAENYLLIGSMAKRQVIRNDSSMKDAYRCLKVSEDVRGILWTFRNF
jgi:hypothetical protein